MEGGRESDMLHIFKSNEQVSTYWIIQNTSFIFTAHVLLKYKEQRTNSVTHVITLSRPISQSRAILCNKTLAIQVSFTFSKFEIMDT